MCDFSYIISHIPFAEFLLHVLALSSTGLEILVPRENVSIRRQNNGPIELENKIVTWLFEGVMPLNQQEEKNVTLLVGYQGEIGLLLCIEVRSTMSRI